MFQFSLLQRKQYPSGLPESHYMGKCCRLQHRILNSPCMNRWYFCSCKESWEAISHNSSTITAAPQHNPAPLKALIFSGSGGGGGMSSCVDNVPPTEIRIQPNGTLQDHDVRQKHVCHNAISITYELAHIISHLQNTV